MYIPMSNNVLYFDINDRKFKFEKVYDYYIVTLYENEEKVISHRFETKEQAYTEILSYAETDNFEE